MKRSVLKEHAPALLIVGLIVGYVLYQHFFVPEGFTIGGVVLTNGQLVKCSDHTNSDTSKYGLYAMVIGDKVRRFVAVNFGGVAALYKLTGTTSRTMSCKAVLGPDITTPAEYTALKANPNPTPSLVVVEPPRPVVAAVSTMTDVEKAKKTWTAWFDALLVSAKLTTTEAEKQAAGIKAAADSAAAGTKAAADSAAAGIVTAADSAAAGIVTAAEKKATDTKIVADDAAAALKVAVEQQAAATRAAAEQQATATRAASAAAKVAADKEVVAARALADKTRADAVAAKVAADNEVAAAKAVAEKTKADTAAAKAAADKEVAAAKVLAEKTKADAKAVADRDLAAAKTRIDRDTAALTGQIAEFATTSNAVKAGLDAEKKKLADEKNMLQTGAIVAAGLLGVVLVGGVVYSMTRSSPAPTMGAGRRRR